MVGRCISKSHASRHVGRYLDNISRGLSNKIPVYITEGNLRPEEPLQAAKLASEADIILRNHVLIFTHWKHYKNKENKGVVKDFNDKVSVSNLAACIFRNLFESITINADADPVKDAFSDLLKKGQRQMRYRLKKQYFNGIPANQVRTTSPLSSMTDRKMYKKTKKAKQTKFKDVPPTAIDIFKDTHCSSKSGFNESTKDAIAQMEAYLAQPIEEGKDPKTPVEAVARVLPKSTFLLNVGMQSIDMKRNAKAAAINDRVRELESELQAEKMGSAGMQLQIADLQKQVEDQKEAARKNEEETEKLRQQGSEVQSFLRSLFGSKFASYDAQQ
uniref:Uncharacterized protein n=1 Tax=Oryza punctata TaxID=4537 RepID=A0A0E0L053_ORYPU